MSDPDSKAPPDPLAGALLVIADCRAWPQVRARLDEHGLSEVLGPEGLLQVMAAWQGERAHALSDPELAGELAHWAGGGGYREHLAGFNALPPAALLAEAERRGWFVQALPGGRKVVNPPTGKPLVVPEGPAPEA